MTNFWCFWTSHGRFMELYLKKKKKVFHVKTYNIAAQILNSVLDFYCFCFEGSDLGQLQ